MGAPMAAFLARLAFFNAHSRGLDSLQYALFARAREVGWTSTVAIQRAFVAAVGAAPGVVAPSAVELLGYLAFDRVGTVVEAASRLLHCGALLAVPEGSPPIPAPVYAAAIAALPGLPPELEAVQAQVALGAARARDLHALARLRERRSSSRLA